jgi:hypothetical protein
MCECVHVCACMYTPTPMQPIVEPLVIQRRAFEADMHARMHFNICVISICIVYICTCTHIHAHTHTHMHVHIFAGAIETLVDSSAYFGNKTTLTHTYTYTHTYTHTYLAGAIEALVDLLACPTSEIRLGRLSVACLSILSAEQAAKVCYMKVCMCGYKYTFV